MKYQLLLYKAIDDYVGNRSPGTKYAVSRRKEGSGLAYMGADGATAFGPTAFGPTVTVIVWWRWLAARVNLLPTGTLCGQLRPSFHARFRTPYV
jgi:hypothetical protein